MVEHLPQIPQRDNFNLMGWYKEIPCVTRIYLTAAFGTTALCALDFVSPFSLYFNYKLIFHKVIANKNLNSAFLTTLTLVHPPRRVVSVVATPNELPLLRPFLV